MNAKNAKLNEEHKRRLKVLLEREDNQRCADCGAKAPRWASVNLGLFMCMRCCGIHRSLGTHLSQCRSVALDTWTPKQFIESVGNARANTFFERNLPKDYPKPNDMTDDGATERFIRSKYERRMWVPREGQSIRKTTKRQNKRNEDPTPPVRKSQQPRSKERPKQLSKPAPEERKRVTARPPTNAKPAMQSGNMMADFDEDFLLGPTQTRNQTAPLIGVTGAQPKANVNTVGGIGYMPANGLGLLSGIQPTAMGGNTFYQEGKDSYAALKYPQYYNHYSTAGHVSPHGMQYGGAETQLGSNVHALNSKSAPVSRGESPVPEEVVEENLDDAIFNTGSDHNSTKNSILALFGDTGFQGVNPVGAGSISADQFLSSFGNSTTQPTGMRIAHSTNAPKKIIDDAEAFSELRL